jgi:hypothetical protein
MKTSISIGKLSNFTCPCAVTTTSSIMLMHVTIAPSRRLLRIKSAFQELIIYDERLSMHAKCIRISHRIYFTILHRTVMISRGEKCKVRSKKKCQLMGKYILNSNLIKHRLMRVKPLIALIINECTM